MTDKPKTIQEALAEVQRKVNEQRAERIKNMYTELDEAGVTGGVVAGARKAFDAGRAAIAAVNKGGQAAGTKLAQTGGMGVNPALASTARPVAAPAAAAAAPVAGAAGAAAPAAGSLAQRAGSAISGAAGRAAETAGSALKSPIGAAAIGAGVGAGLASGGNKTAPGGTPAAAAPSSGRMSDVAASAASGTPDSRMLRAPVQAPKGEGKVGSSLAGLGVSREDRRNQDFVTKQLGAGFKAGSAEANIALAKKFQDQKNAVTSAEKPSVAAPGSQAAPPVAPVAPVAPAAAPTGAAGLPVGEVPKPNPAAPVAVAAPAKDQAAVSNIANTITGGGSREDVNKAAAAAGLSGDEDGGKAKGKKKVSESALINAFFNLHNTKAGNIFEAAKKMKGCPSCGKMNCGCSPVKEELKGNQTKIDANHNGKVDSQDFKILRSKKQKVKESTDFLFSEDELMRIAGIEEAIVSGKEVTKLGQNPSGLTGGRMKDGVPASSLTDEKILEARGVKAGSKRGPYKQKGLATGEGEEERSTPAVTSQIQAAKEDETGHYTLTHPSTGEKFKVPRKDARDHYTKYHNTEKPRDKETLEAEFLKKHSGNATRSKETTRSVDRDLDTIEKSNLRNKENRSKVSLASRA